jgi:hypothetical protein
MFSNSDREKRRLRIDAVGNEIMEPCIRCQQEREQYATWLQQCKDKNTLLETENQELAQNWARAAEFDSKNHSSVYHS